MSVNATSARRKPSRCEVIFPYFFAPRENTVASLPRLRDNVNCPLTRGLNAPRQVASIVSHEHHPDRDSPRQTGRRRVGGGNPRRGLAKCLSGYHSGLWTREVDRPSVSG